MSVRGTMADDTFAAYLHGSFNPPSYNQRPPLQNPRLSQARRQAQAQLRLRTMAGIQQRPVLDTSAYGIANNSTSSADTPLSAAVSDASFSPDDFFHLPDEQSSAWSLDGPQWYGTQGMPASNPFLFRPTELETPLAPTQGTVNHGDAPTGGGTCIQPPSLNRSPQSFASRPAILSNVDTSQYENINNDYWRSSSIDHDNAPSPSSIDSHSNGPFTPVEPLDGEAFGPSFHRKSNPLAIEGLPANVATSSISNPLSSFSNMSSFSNASSSLSSNASSSFGSLSLPSWSGSMQNNHSQGPAFSTAAAFGGLNHASQYIPSGQVLPLTAIPPSVAFNGYVTAHTHGPPQVALPPHQNQPVYVAPHQVNQTFTGTLQELDQSRWETSSEELGSEDDSIPDVNEQALEDARLRRDRDKYLLKMRERGLSYKEIKRRGKFKEAESTLRGRIRVLTKDKSERVRRPDWTAEDITLLEEAVRLHENTDGSTRGRDGHGRVPWKKISGWMREQGGSYTFAPATCAKKWREMHSG